MSQKSVVSVCGLLLHTPVADVLLMCKDQLLRERDNRVRLEDELEDKTRQLADVHIKLDAVCADFTSRCLFTVDCHLLAQWHSSTELDLRSIGCHNSAFSPQRTVNE